MSPENMESFCQGDYEPPMELFNPLVQKGYKMTVDIDERIAETVGSTMCVKKMCPCKPLGDAIE